MQQKNIAFIGLAGSGKSTLAKYLETDHDYKRVSFARPIKQEIGRMLNSAGVGTEPLQAVEDNKAAVRPLLQACGQVMRAVAGTDYWLNLALAEIKAHNAAGIPVVIDDLRYPNEADALRRLGFAIVRVHRDSSGLVGEQGQHESEAGQVSIGADYEVWNNRTLGYAYGWVQYLVYCLAGGWWGRC